MTDIAKTPNDDTSLPLRCGLEKFAKHVDGFALTLRSWRDTVGDSFEEPWKEMTGTPTDSFSDMLDEFLLEVLERQVLCLRALRDAYLQDVYQENDGDSSILHEAFNLEGFDPFDLPAEANRFRDKAELKLLYLESQIKKLRDRLGLSGQTGAADDRRYDDDPSNGSGGRTLGQAPPALNRETASGRDEDPPLTASSGSRHDSAAQKDEPVSREESGAGSVEKTAEKGAADSEKSTREDSAGEQEQEEVAVDDLRQAIDRMRRTHDTPENLKISTPDGVKRYALEYFDLDDEAEGDVTLIDLEGFVVTQRDVLDETVQRVYEQGDGEDDEKRAKTLLKQAHKFFKALYRDARNQVSTRSSGQLPDTGGRIDNSVFLKLEAMLNMREWSSTEDVESFDQSFKSALEAPFEELLNDTEEYRTYLESIISFHPSKGQ